MKVNVGFGWCLPGRKVGGTSVATFVVPPSRSSVTFMSEILRGRLVLGNSDNFMDTAVNIPGTFVFWKTFGGVNCKHFVFLSGGLLGHHFLSVLLVYFIEILVRSCHVHIPIRHTRRKL